MEEFKSQIISGIRSCLISTKGQVTLRQLEDDYRTLLGDRIPYQKLGHKTLESFVQSEPTLITSRGANGEILVDAKVNEKTEHISSMVRKQKTSGVKKRVRIVNPPPRLNRYNSYNNNNNQPPPLIPKWRPKKNPYSVRKPPHENSSRLAAVSHNQFVSSPTYKKPKVPSKVVVPETTTTKKMSPPPPQPPPPSSLPLRRELRRYNSSPEKIESNGTAANGGDEWREDCSPLSSTMKRISRIMSEISVERDSGNSSPTTEEVGYKLVEFTKTGDPIIDVRAFAAYHKLGDVEVKFTETKAKHSKIAQCHCKIMVDQHIYSSYPKDFYDKSAAERHAAQKALDDLMQKYSKRRSLLLSNNEDIIERIPPMLQKHNTAVWMWQIEADYIDKYNEQLPPNWLQVIDNSPQVSIENCTRGYVLKYCNPDDKGKRLEISLNVGDVSVPCNTVKVGESNRLFAVVTAVHSVNEVWCRHVRSSDYEKFCDMLTQMEVYYNNHASGLVAKSVNLSSCYVIHQESTWSRVRAVSLPQDGYVDCFLIDFGEEAHVPVDQIYVLKREFAVEEAQAFVCRLDGLEDFHEISIDSEHLNAVIGTEFVLEIVTDEIGDCNTDVTFPVVLYDSETGVSLNQELMSIFAVESAIPSIDQKAITEVHVSNIEANGDVYVQVHTPGFYVLTDILSNLTEHLSKNQPDWTPPTKETSENRIFLVKDQVSQRWQRATIMDWSPTREFAQVYFIDQGHTQVINVLADRVYPVEDFDESLGQFVAQALKVRIMIEKIPGDLVKRAEKLLPPDQPVLLKIISYDNENVAWVEFFKRTNDGVLFFINRSISVEPELLNYDGNNASNNNEITRKRLINWVQFGDATKTVPSGGSLRKPDLPKMGDYFNVNIPFSVNPWNFFVQPLETLNQLTALMADMQEYYKDIQYSPMQIDDIVPGKIYASKHDDGLWYRTSVLKVIHSGSISVFYCDFGYYTNLTLTQLIPLDAKYMSFPYQALKAKIAGIKPIKNKWTMEDCDTFNSLVTKKKFVSILVNIEKDELYKSDIILQLLLIDTSSDEDINIKDLLIEKGIATSV